MPNTLEVGESHPQICATLEVPKFAQALDKNSKVPSLGSFSEKIGGTKTPEVPYLFLEVEAYLIETSQIQI